MGRAEGTSDNGMMSAGEIAAHLLRCCSSLDQFDAYMFGSTLGGIGEDVDLLFVGPDGETLSQLKRELRVAGEFLPLHVVYMQPSEEQHADFVARQKCVPLRTLASSAPDLAPGPEEWPGSIEPTDPRAVGQATPANYLKRNGGRGKD